MEELSLTNGVIIFFDNVLKAKEAEKGLSGSRR